MKIAIIGKLKRGYEEIKLIKEAKEVFNRVLYVPAPHTQIQINDEILMKFKDIDLSTFDCILPRIPSSYRGCAFNLISLLKDEVFIPIDPMSLFYAHNKFLTLLILKENGLPVPETYLAVKRDILDSLLDELKFPIVMKILYGSLGKGVIFADSKQSAASFMDTLERFQEPIFVEEFVPNPGEDIRVYIVGYHPIACMKRIAKKDEKRANVGIGGKGVKFRLPEKYEDIAIDASRALGMGICGLDLIEGPRGPVFIEANINAQFKGLEKTTGVNVAKKIIEYMKEKCSE